MAEQFTFKARITLDSVDVHVTADSEAQARKKAERGAWDEADYNAGDPIVINISLNPATR